MPVDFDAIPAELREQSRWMMWRWTWRDGKWTKPPRQRDGSMAKSTVPATWCTFGEARAAYESGGFDGIGFSLHGADYIGVDFDDVRDPDSGEILEPWAGAIRKLDSYAEVSPSGTGVKVVVRAALPEQRRKQSADGHVESYGTGRYFTITGHRLPDAPAAVNERQAAVEWLQGTFIHPPHVRDVLADSDRQRGEPLMVPDDVDVARAALGQLSPARAGNYSDWLHVGMALRAVDDSLLGDWDEWSRQDAKYSDGACAAKWQSFGRGGVSLGSLIHWAREDSPGWTLPRRNGAGHNGRLRVAPCPDDIDEPDPIADPWPDPLADEAFHGVAGAIVRAIEPHSEADPVALLVQALAGFGNVIGRTAHFRAEADEHHGKLFACLVGITSKGRKGTSWSQVCRILRTIDPEWADTRILSGLSSGEGLIWQVRDPISKREPIRNKKMVTGYREVEADPGVGDKRLLIIESELGSVLRVLRREQNTLSAVVRDAWDKGNLRTLTKNSPAVATGCHASILGHITRNELRRHLAECDIANGFANRFLWLCVRRSKCLPEGGRVDQVDFAPLVNELRAAVTFARTCGEVRRNAEAREVWAAVYPELSEGRPGLLGAVTSRAEAQVMRLAMLYALLDRSAEIRPEHLTAALAVWEYAEQSARHIFGSALGDPTADEILRALRGAQAGMTRNELREHFHRNKSSDEIARALAALAECGLARSESRQTGGRPAEVWMAA